MAKKAKKDNKNLIIGICCGVVALVVVVVVAIVLITANNNALSDDYFQSDDTKYVLSVDADTLDIESDDSDVPSPVKTHLVYTYSGDEITGLKTYAEYANADDAKTAFDAMQAADSDESIELNGKYIVATNDAEDYEGLTASDVKQQIQLMEALKSMNSSDDSDTTDGATEVEETVEVENE